jgi:hypothetical protein
VRGRLNRADTEPVHIFEPLTMSDSRLTTLRRIPISLVWGKARNIDESQAQTLTLKADAFCLVSAFHFCARIAARGAWGSFVTAKSRMPQRAPRLKPLPRQKE